ncbi:hypothetical protein HY991_03600 [Candidatus Micrarchaeota archaeon]|nr:hypothetical protein [Candidatus Micrarchaeota archaeon]
MCSPLLNRVEAEWTLAADLASLFTWSNWAEVSSMVLPMCSAAAECISTYRS